MTFEVIATAECPHCKATVKEAFKIGDPTDCIVACPECQKVFIIYLASERKIITVFGQIPLPRIPVE